MRTSFNIHLSVLVILLVFTSCVNTNKTITATASYPLATVQGSVIDEEKETPVSGATVWVEGTTIKTETDSEGKYTMKVPRGVYEVQVERSGYEEKQERIEIENRSGRVSDFNFALTSKPQRSLGAYNAGQENSGRTSALSEKHKDFISYYINNDLNCELKNPEDVRFADSDDDVLWINNPVKLEVINQEMGYRIIVDLEEFVSKEYSEILGLDVTAGYYFEEMEPSNEKEAETWAKNRIKHFEGSLRHFLIATASEKSLMYYGYRIYSGQSVSTTSAMAFSSSSVSDIEVKKENIISPNIFTDTGNNVLSFKDELRVEYIRKSVEDPAGIMGLNSYQYQTAWLSLNGNYAEFTDNGILRNPQSVQEKGVWRYTPVCKMVPFDYLPPVN